MHTCLLLALLISQGLKCSERWKRVVPEFPRTLHTSNPTLGWDPGGDGLIRIGCRGLWWKDKMRPSVPADLDKVCIVGLVRTRPNIQHAGPLAGHRVILIHTGGLHRKAFCRQAKWALCCKTFDSDWSEDIGWFFCENSQVKSLISISVLVSNICNEPALLS